MKYQIQITPAAQKAIQKLPPAARGRVRDAIEKLADQPHPAGVKKLQGLEDTYRIRVGNFRVLYQFFDAKLIVLGRIPGAEFRGHRIPGTPYLILDVFAVCR
jgi:mRNA interferase RelE/StbE